MNSTPPSPLQEVIDHPGAPRGIRLFVKRDDQLHPEVEGSKWRKIAPVIETVQVAGLKGIITFGGPFSNHLQAVATAGRLFEIPTFGIVRGLHADLNNPTLHEAKWNGMMIFPMAKAEYEATKNRANKIIGSEFPNYYVLPEGGATQESVEACEQLGREIIGQLGETARNGAPITVCLPAGTGTTAAGLIAGLSCTPAEVLIFPATDDLTPADVFAHLGQMRHRFAQFPRFRLVRDYVFGGFAKYHPQLLDFARSFRDSTDILLDPVYTNKMIYGIYDLLRQGAFPEGSTVVAVHTGGLQGWKGFGYRYGVGI